MGALYRNDESLITRQIKFFQRVKKSLFSCMEIATSAGSEHTNSRMAKFMQVANRFINHPCIIHCHKRAFRIRIYCIQENMLYWKRGKLGQIFLRQLGREQDAAGNIRGFCQILHNFRTPSMYSLMNTLCRSLMIWPCFTILQNLITPREGMYPLDLGKIPYEAKISKTRFRVSSPTPALLFSTIDTVDTDTPASLAISLLVILPKTFSSKENYTMSSFIEKQEHFGRNKTPAEITHHFHFFWYAISFSIKELVSVAVRSNAGARIWPKGRPL